MSEFERLKAEWAAKLKAAGFHEIESPDGRLHRSHPDRIGDPEYLDRMREYQASPSAQKLGARDRRILDLHAQGFSVRQIASLLGVRCYPNIAGRVTRLKARAKRWRRVHNLHSRGGCELRTEQRLNAHESSALDALAHFLGLSRQATMRTLLTRSTGTSAGRRLIEQIKAEISNHDDGPRPRKAA